MGFLSERNSTFQQVKDFHLNSDVDQNAISQHHTLGPLANQASPGDHIHDGKTSNRIGLSDLAGVNVPYTVTGGALVTNITFTGTSPFSGSYTKAGNLCYFAIDIDMDNITSFGAGQYFVSLPFPSARTAQLSDGCLHDASLSEQYSITGHVTSGQSQLRLSSVGLMGKQAAFTGTVPVALATADNFHISGTYEIQQ